MSELFKSTDRPEISPSILIGTGDRIFETNLNRQYRSPLIVRQTGEQALAAVFLKALNSDKGTVVPAQISPPKPKQHKKGYLNTRFS